MVKSLKYKRIFSRGGLVITTNPGQNNQAALVKTTKLLWSNQPIQQDNTQQTILNTDLQDLSVE